MFYDIFKGILACICLLFCLLALVFTFLIERYFKITSQMECHKDDNAVKEKKDK